MGRAVVIKTCPCCRRTYDAESWSALELCGYVGAFQAHGRRYAVELRHCECRSTIGIEVQVPELEAA